MSISEQPKMCSSRYERECSINLGVYLKPTNKLFLKEKFLNTKCAFVLLVQMASFDADFQPLEAEETKSKTRQQHTMNFHTAA